MHFYKYHGIGNDFIIYDGINATITPDFFNEQNVQQICHRHFGIGGDGVLWVSRGQAEGNFAMRLFNSDGSEGEMCGNGIRCVAAFIFDHIQEAASYQIETLAGIKIIAMNEYKKGAISVNMGKPVFDAASIPTVAPLSTNNLGHMDENNYSFDFFILSTGVPHCVIFVSELDEELITNVAPLIEKHRFFPEGANVNFVKIIDRSRAQIIVWERGAGFTLACGTGACAVAVAGAISGRTERAITAVLPGGELQVVWQDDGDIIMRGGAQQVFETDMAL
jgi:diaminopimelate epimerase